MSAPGDERTDAPADGPRLEIERTFLVRALPDDLDAHRSARLQQGYIALDPAGAVVRIRRSEPTPTTAGEPDAGAGGEAAQHVMAVKGDPPEGADGGRTRTEEELSLGPRQFERLWPLTAGRRVEKTRYRVPHGPLVIELDVYHGDLDGLLTAEVEAATAEQVDAFTPPGWVGAEVTGDRRFGNAALAVHGMPPARKAGDRGLLAGEHPASGLRQVALAEVDGAIDALRGGEPQAEAIHTSRKSFKRVRALIRLARKALDDDVRARDDERLRDAGRLLSGARDATVLVETLDAVVERFAGDLAGADMGPLRTRLVERRGDAEADAQGGSGNVEEVLAMLDAARGDVAGWALAGPTGAALAAGFRRIHARGRRALELAEESTGEERTEAMHDLRKRAKDLWHASELLEVAAPKQLRSIRKRSKRLADLIGEDHDLAVLLAQAEALCPTLADGSAVEALHAPVARRRRKLQRKALELAGDLYRETSAKTLAARIARLDDAAG